MNAKHHPWRFFRAGGFDQVRLETGADLCAVENLDQKLWVALACPTRGLEFDAKTLELIDTDHDGRIRAPEIIAAAKWTCGLLKDPGELTKSSHNLPLESISEATAEGKVIRSSARQILANLGKGEATAITAEDTADTVKIFAQTKFNGDGILPADAAESPATQSVIADIITCLGAETDRSGKPGITQEKADLFFADAEAFASWHAQPETDAAKMPLGAATAAGAAAMKAVATKIEDYFARCKLAAFDPRAMAAVNRSDADYAAATAQELSSGGAGAIAIATFPLARVTPDGELPLSESLSEINPAWRGAMALLREQVIKPLLGGARVLTEHGWAMLLAKFAPFDAWLAAKAGTSVEKLGLERVRTILGSGAKKEIAELLARDKALEPEAANIANVDRLVRYHRDLYKLLNNFVAFRDFYSRKAKAVFQIGTLFLDQRSCDLCVRVDDPGKHALMANLSRSYLVYCDCTRKGSAEKLTIAAAVTAGDSDNLMVGRNGVFYDRAGNDWDATITKIVDNPISIRQAFFSPYKKVIRLISDQLAKRAAAADDAATQRLKDRATAVTDEVVGNAAPPAPPKPKIDVGVVAALGVAVGGLTAALGTVMGAFFGLGLWMPLGLVALLLMISGPSMLIAFFKLRQRNLGPILDANGWAVNAKAKINIPFGRSLTQVAKLPAGATRDLADPFAERHTGRNWTIGVAAAIVVVLSCWYFGCFQKYMPAGIPKSGYVLRKEAAATQEAANKQAKTDAAAKAATQPAAATQAVEPATAK